MKKKYLYHVASVFSMPDGFAHHCAMAFLDQKIDNAERYAAFMERMKKETGHEDLTFTALSYHGIKYVDDVEPKEFDGLFRVIDMDHNEVADMNRLKVEIRDNDDQKHWSWGLVYTNLDGFSIDEDGDLYLHDSCGGSRMADPERFKIQWNEGDEIGATIKAKEDSETSTADPVE